MTNEEAINVLFQVKDALINSNSWLESTKEPITDAFNLAIEALKAQLSSCSEIPNSSDDLISKQDAITAIIRLPTWYYDSDRHYGDPLPPMEALLDPEDVVSAIENLPSAQPEHETGKWLDNPVDPVSPTMHCFKCGYTCLGYDSTTGRLYYFCPVCGADMRKIK